MRVVLELLSGPEKGRKMRLAAEQSLIVGRTEWADFVTAHDARMSSKHFVLEVDPEHCHLRDLGSANGTLVNGEPATEKVLRNGDQITAGDSTFVVSIEGGCCRRRRDRDADR